MGRKIIVGVLGAVLVLGLWQHFHKRDAGLRLVSAIEVEYGATCKVYREPEQMSLILNRLRSLGQRYAPELDPEALSGPTVRIRLIYSDGTRLEHQIKPDRYVRTGEAKWQQADPKQIQSLMLLLKKSNAFY